MSHSDSGDGIFCVPADVIPCGIDLLGRDQVVAQVVAIRLGERHVQGTRCRSCDGGGSRVLLLLLVVGGVLVVLVEVVVGSDGWGAGGTG